MARKKVMRQEEQPKRRKRRKPMTEEQRLAAAERLEKARAARKPSENISIHESIRDLPDDHELHPDKVKMWIKDWKMRLSSINHYQRSKEAKEVAKYFETDGYIKNMQRYLDSGVWTDMYWGENRDQKMGWVCIALSYDKNGNPKRTKGTYYSDLGYVWGEEPIDET